MQPRGEMFDPDVARLARRFQPGANVVVFTGAGISTGSGIPDFRGPDGVWKRHRPVYYDEFLRSRQARIRHWEYKLEGWAGFRDSRPNAAHKALVELERRGFLHCLVTQNIDGLHQMAGNAEERVVELHGTNRRIECISCGRQSAPDPVFERFRQTREPPLCECGGFLKPATISFGQAMPAEKVERAFEAARRADVVLAIGSSTADPPPTTTSPTSASKATRPKSCPPWCRRLGRSCRVFISNELGLEARPVMLEFFPCCCVC